MKWNFLLTFSILLAQLRLLRLSPCVYMWWSGQGVISAMCQTCRTTDWVT